jgi:hypothetical protein
MPSARPMADDGRVRHLEALFRDAILNGVTRVVHLPCVAEQDEDADGGWCASAHLRADVAAFGGVTQEEAITDLRASLELLLEQAGLPDDLTLTLNVASFSMMRGA